MFNELRDTNNLEGKCGCCEFRNICMGCRARAFAATGNYLDEEPFCVYEPKTKDVPAKHAGMKNSETRQAPVLVEIGH